jgi:hypothetical protein
MYLAWQPTRRPAPQRAGIGALVPARYTPGTRQVHRRRRCQSCDNSNQVTPNSSSKTAVSPPGCPGPSNPTDERSGQPRPFAHPQSVTVSRTVTPVISAPPSGRPRSGKTRGRRADTRGCTHDSTARVEPEHAAGTARPWPSVKKSTVTLTARRTRTPSAYARGHRNMTVHSATR